MKENKPTEKKPQKVLIPVIFLIALNLIIYLYVIATGVRVLDLLPYNQSKINDYLIIGSYFISTFAMLLSLTAYFNVSADLKRLKTKNVEEPQNDILLNLEEDNISGSISNNIEDSAKPLDIIQNGDNNENKQSKTNEDTIEQKSSNQNLNVVIKDTKTNVTIDKEESRGWKKIGVKLTDISDNEKSEAISTDVKKDDSLSGDSIKSEEYVIEEETENLDNETLQEDQKEIEDESREIISDNIDDNIDKNDIENNITNEIQQNEVENSIDASLGDDSEVLKNLEELKIMVDEMKIKLEKRKMNRENSKKK